MVSPAYLPVSDLPVPDRNLTVIIWYIPEYTYLSKSSNIPVHTLPVQFPKGNQPCIYHLVGDYLIFKQELQKWLSVEN